MPRIQALLLVFLFIASAGIADSELVRLIRPSSPTGSSGAWGLQRFGSDAIFRAWDVDSGMRLWKTDGTTAGTVPLLDLNPGTDNSSLAFTTIGNTIWIAANDGRHGSELWTSDGTEAGTTMVRDIVPGARGSAPSSFTAAGAYVYFLADDAVHGRELWRSDGTASGTRLVRDILPGATGTFAMAPKIIGPVAAGLLFMANDGTRGWELWVTDGTEEGTRMVEEIVPGSGSIDLDPAIAVKLGTHVYLPLNDGVHAREIWKSDGTAAGTYLVKDVSAGGLPESPDAYATAGGHLVFIDRVGGNLWRSDGTEAGTVQIASRATNVYSWGAKAVFFGNGMSQTDGTAAGTQQISSAVGSASVLQVVGSRLFFFSGTTLWVSDGTAAGTKAVKQVPLPLEPRAFAFTPGYLGAVGDVFLFQGLDPATGHEMWRSDGTAEGTTILRDIYDRPAGTNAFPMWIARGSLGDIGCFTADDGKGPALWKSDGTAAGTVLVTEGIREVATLFRAGNALYANFPSNGLKPVRYDGTGLSVPLNSNDFWSTDSYATPYHGLAGVAYFAADDGSGYELWRWNGANASPATRVADIQPGRGSSFPSSIVVMGGRLVFAADDGSTGNELWTSDGTTAGTTLLKDIHPSASSNPSSLTVVGRFIYFFADDGTSGRELWRTDGTSEGTQLVADAVGGPDGLAVADAIAVGTTFFFTTDYQLWKSDATGTVMVREFANGFAAATESPALPPLYSINGRLVFFADDGVSGREPWVSDGTAGGTFLLKDIHPGPSSSAAWSATPVGEMLFFAAHDPEHGTELWRTDGTTEGTELAADVAPGAASSIPMLIPALTHDVLFLASTPSRGYQLHRWVASSVRRKRRAV